ncbi:hypothetical protein D3C72_2461000 [compost metagenome]
MPVTLGRQGLLDGEPMLVIDGVTLAPVGTTLLRVQAGLIREGTAVTLTPAATTATMPPVAAATTH